MKLCCSWSRGTDDGLYKILTNVWWLLQLVLSYRERRGTREWGNLWSTSVNRVLRCNKRSVLVRLYIKPCFYSGLTLGTASKISWSSIIHKQGVVKIFSSSHRQHISVINMSQAVYFVVNSLESKWRRRRKIKGALEKFASLYLTFNCILSLMKCIRLTIYHLHNWNSP